MSNADEKDPSKSGESFKNTAEIEKALRSGDVGLRGLYNIWEQRKPVPEPGKDKKYTQGSDGPQVSWMQDNLSLVRMFTASALQKEEFRLVCDAALEAFRVLPRPDEDQQTELVKLRIDYAKALTRLGSTHKAREQLEPCLKDDFRPILGDGLKVDILLELGDTLREESYHAASPAERHRTAEEALGFYRAAYDLEPTRLRALVFTAAGAFIVGEGTALREESQTKARQILELVHTKENSDGPRLETTRAKAVAHAILGQIKEAEEAYSKLQTMPNVTTAYLAEARFFAEFLAEAMGQSRDFFKKNFPPLQLIVFAGHQPDLRDAPPRFPVDKIDEIRAKIRKTLDDLDARVGLVSASAGADLLFIEALLERKGEVDLILPWTRDEFRRTSVAPFDEGLEKPLWVPLYDRALREATTIREIGQSYEPGSAIGWEYLAEVAAGIALLMARTKRLDVQPVALWDNRPGRGLGGTQSFVSLWDNELQRETRVIPMPEVTRADRPQTRTSHPTDRSEKPTLHQEVKSMLFADIVGYSKLTERVIPEFVETFLGRVSNVASNSKHAPRSVNTWGDAVYAVFDYARDAGLFALELTKMIQESEKVWEDAALYWDEHVGENKELVRHVLSIRIGLHTGPVFMHYNPVIRELGYTGSHVNRAARIEPVTKPGEVYASEEFAALAELGSEINRRAPGKHPGNAADASMGLVCEYAGSMQLAKGYPGRFRIYRVLPKRVLAIEELAREIHAAYVAEEKAKGKTVETNPSLRPWEELPEDSRDSNRAQAADIPNKLRALGYELAPSHGIPATQIEIPADVLEKLAIREHDRWVNERTRRGWTYGVAKDFARKYHPMLVPWEQLSDEEKKKDRDTVVNAPRLVEKAGFRVRKLMSH